MDKVKFYIFYMKNIIFFKLKKSNFKYKKINNLKKIKEE